VTPEEMEQSVNELRDNQVVQGQLLHRVEGRFDRIELIVERNALAIQQNTQAIGKLADGMEHLQAAIRAVTQTVEGLVEKVGGLADRIVVLESVVQRVAKSVEGLTKTVDRFIRGMEGNGHRRKKG
jgi:methyl-accepting chemotaxis protein